jgi:hypothetical protein
MTRIEFLDNSGLLGLAISGSAAEVEPLVQ